MHLDPSLMTILITAGAALLTALAQLAVALAGYLKSKSNAAALAENTILTKESAKKIDEVHAATDVIKAATGNTDVSKLRANQPTDKGV